MWHILFCLLLITLLPPLYVVMNLISSGTGNSCVLAKNKKVGMMEG